MHISPLVILLAWIPVWRLPLPPLSGTHCNSSELLSVAGRFFPARATGRRMTHFPTGFSASACRPSYFLTKATAIGLAALAGLLLFHSADWKKFRPGICDLPMLVWCCVPLLSAAAHWKTLHEGLLWRNLSNHLLGRALAAGPHLLFQRRLAAPRRQSMRHRGNLLCPDLSLRDLRRAAALCVPLWLSTLPVGGSRRYIGFRPIGLLGGWKPTGDLDGSGYAVCRLHLWFRLTGRILGLPMEWVAAGLAAVTLLCQSVGSILLLLILMPLALLKRRFLLRAFVAVLSFGHSVLRTLPDDEFRILAFTGAAEWPGRIRSRPP